MADNMDKDTKAKISRLQILEQRTQALLMQKHSFQSQALEIENALGEIEDSKETYKIVGTVMVSVEKEQLKKDLTEKKEITDLKIKNLEKEEKKLRLESGEIQKEIMGLLKDE